VNVATQERPQEVTFHIIHCEAKEHPLRCKHRKAVIRTVWSPSSDP
jgi:hypothetical protein